MRCMGKCYLTEPRWWKHWTPWSLPISLPLHLAQQRWGPCSGLLTWWLIHFRSFYNLNPLVNEKIECKHRALHQHDNSNAVSPWRLAGDHSQVQIQPLHLPAANYFNEHMPTLNGSNAQTIPDLKSKSSLCWAHLGRRMLDPQGPSRRLKRKWGQAWRNYPCVSIQAVAVTATSFQRFNWTFFIGLDCSSRPAPQLRLGMMIQCTYTTLSLSLSLHRRLQPTHHWHFPRASYGLKENEHPADQPKTSPKQQGHLFARSSAALPKQWVWLWK